jgi:hypothetical protein
MRITDILGHRIELCAGLLVIRPGAKLSEKTRKRLHEMQFEWRYDRWIRKWKSWHELDAVIDEVQEVMADLVWPLGGLERLAYNSGMLSLAIGYNGEMAVEIPLGRRSTYSGRYAIDTNLDELLAVVKGVDFHVVQLDHEGDAGK